MKYPELKGKVGILTGASRGIGKEIAYKLSQNGVHLTIASRNKEKLDLLAVELRKKYKTKVLPIVVDVQEEGMVIHMIRQAAEQFGQIDILINNAGYVDPVGLLEMSLTTWNRIISTNLTGPFLCTREAVRFMKQHGGKILNIASTAGMSPRPGWSAYAASKAGLINFSNTMSSELKDYGIRVYCLSPGRTATELRRILSPDEDPTIILQPEQVAETVLFLLCDNGNYIDHQAIVIR
jgi:short-subunit dehydrogenase